MTISVDDTLPAAVFRFWTGDAPGEIAASELFGGRKVAVFAMPGAFTRTCSAEHLPGVIDAAQHLRAKGVDEVVVLVVNDVFVVDAWGKALGADAAGVRLLADPTSAFVNALGLSFSAEPLGFVDRSQRFSMLVEDNVVKVLNVEEPGQCSISKGEALVDQV